MRKILYTRPNKYIFSVHYLTMDNNISAWLDKADDVMLDDFDPNEDDSE
jgi:hypothetical protein